MRAIILAAGRGKRMQALTETTPKPLLQAGQHRLIEYHLYAFAKVGITDVVINVSYRALDIIQYLGSGERYGVKITFSYEPEDGGLETAGGIVQALPLLGGDAFLAVAADVYTDYDWRHLPKDFAGDAHLTMVPNPEFHPEGDYGLQEGMISLDAPHYTYASFALFRPSFFAGVAPGFRKLRELLDPAIAAGKVSGELIEAEWFNVGTPAQLLALDKRLV